MYAALVKHVTAKALYVTWLCSFCVSLQGEPGDPGPTGLQGPAGLPGARVSSRCLDNKSVKDSGCFICIYQVQSSLFSHTVEMALVKVDQCF